MKFTVHDVTRDGTPSARVLLSSDFIDIATEGALGLARLRFPDHSEMTQRVLEPGFDLFVICEDGRVHSFVQLQREERRRWQVRLP